MTNLYNELVFLFQRLDWLSAVDILLVAAIFFAVLVLLRHTQAVVLLRGIIVLAVLVGILSAFLRLTAFAWLLRNTLPALVLAIPVIFQPELRRALERLGRASALLNFAGREPEVRPVIEAIATASQRLAERRQGALIVIEREVGLQEYVETGVLLDARLSVELLHQIFFVNTPLHDGAIILRGDRVAAAACVLPLSTQAALTDRTLGLRHRAAFGISEVSDAVAVVVSEETGAISVTHNGRIIRRLDAARLRNILTAFYRPRASAWPAWVLRAFEGRGARREAVPAAREAGKQAGSD